MNKVNTKRTFQNVCILRPYGLLIYKLGLSMYFFNIHAFLLQLAWLVTSTVYSKEPSSSNIPQVFGLFYNAVSISYYPCILPAGTEESHEKFRSG
jgi:hypothetical protein